MADQLALYQVYYDEKQKEKLYPFAIPYFNKEVTPFFENSVIAEIVPSCTAEKIGVVSWRLSHKRGDMFQLTDKTLTAEKIINTEFDVAILTPRGPSHKPLEMAAHWHGEPWLKAFKVFKNFLRGQLCIRVPEELKRSVYENHFVAKREIYQQYVSECLKPSIEFMKGEEVFFIDAGYAKRKSEADKKKYFEKTGRQDWPIAPFILERLFSIWIEGRNYKIIPL
jgi:hypothetical protein